LDTTGFMPVVLQLQPNAPHSQTLDTTGFMPVVLQLEPTAATSKTELSGVEQQSCKLLKYS
jgi:hypothetical protein